MTNDLVLMYMRMMKKGDVASMYYTAAEKAILGCVMIVSDPYPQPRGSQPKSVVVDIRLLGRVRRPISLSIIKAMKRFLDFPPVHLTRLSVVLMPAAQRTLLQGMSH